MLASNSPKIKYRDEVKSTLKTQYHDVCFHRNIYRYYSKIELIFKHEEIVFVYFWYSSTQKYNIPQKTNSSSYIDSIVWMIRLSTISYVTKATLRALASNNNYFVVWKRGIWLILFWVNGNSQSKTWEISCLSKCVVYIEW